jgi:hypothetical protein
VVTLSEGTLWRRRVGEGGGRERGEGGGRERERVAAYMVAAGHEAISICDHHVRVFNMAKVRRARALSHPSRIRVTSESYMSHIRGVKP